MVSIDASDPSAPITVNYGITGGIEGGTTGTVTFATGAAVLTQMVNVTTNGDIVVEANEAVSVVLNTPSANATILVGTGTSSFTDDDATITVSAISGFTTEAGGIATFNVTLNPTPTADVTIALSSDDLTEGTVPASIVIASGVTTGTVTVTGVDDAFGRWRCILFYNYRKCNLYRCFF